jgi:putative spermidine/putrescine transport system permease protein
MERLLKVYLVVLTLFIYLPIFSLTAFSFNSGGLTFPFKELSLEWYARLFRSPKLMEAVYRSLLLALGTMILTTVLGFMSAYVLRERFRGKGFILYLFILGIVIPGITYGLGTALFYQALGIKKSLWAALPVHVIWTLPFGILIMLAGFDPKIRAYEAAAKTLGGSDWAIFREILLPLLFPTILGTALFAFTLSYNESERSIFLLGTDNTIPAEILAQLSARATPELYALGALSTVFSVLLLSLVGWLVLRKKAE